MIVELAKMEKLKATFSKKPPNAKTDVATVFSIVIHLENVAKLTRYVKRNELFTLKTYVESRFRRNRVENVTIATMLTMYDHLHQIAAANNYNKAGAILREKIDLADKAKKNQNEPSTNLVAFQLTSHILELSTWIVRKL